MAERKYFGTDGVRGPYGGDVMNEAFAGRLGDAAGRYLRSAGREGGRVYLGRDTRASGASLERALAAGLTGQGFTAVSLGVVPTPAVSLTLRSTPAELGIVITASHNPAGDNGIKFFGPDGIKLTDAQELLMEGFLPVAVPAPTASALFQLDAERLYIDTALQLLPAGALRGWDIVLDTANGAGCVTSREVLERLGAQLELIGNSPDGSNINAGVGSQHPEVISAAVRRTGARLGIAHDGDADRCLLCDERGDALDGDEILTLLAVHALRTGALRNRTLVVTVQSNLGVDAAVTAAGGRVVRTSVGDRYVIERMRAEGAALGGETSGHIICADVAPTGDGLVAALKVLAVMRETGRPLAELRRVLRKFPQRSAALAVREKLPLATLVRLQEAIRRTEAGLGANGRVLVRYSGTEPKLRLLVEGPDEAAVAAAMDRLLAAARADLAVVI